MERLFQYPTVLQVARQAGCVCECVKVASGYPRQQVLIPLAALIKGVCAIS